MRTQTVPNGQPASHLTIWTVILRHAAMLLCPLQVLGVRMMFKSNRKHGLII